MTHIQSLLNLVQSQKKRTHKKRRFRMALSLKHGLQIKGGRIEEKPKYSFYVLQQILVQKMNKRIMMPQMAQPKQIWRRQIYQMLRSLLTDKSMQATLKSQFCPARFTQMLTCQSKVRSFDSVNGLASWFEPALRIQSWCQKISCGPHTDSTSDCLASASRIVCKVISNLLFSLVNVPFWTRCLSNAEAKTESKHFLLVVLELL